LAVGLALAGCKPSRRASGPAEPPPAPIQVGDTAPDIEGTDADGRAFRLSDYRGKVVLLDFWASW
jgi:cytochrome oxidase Cu insertion factor (SCO1/SenC/PrrC family)